MDHPSSAQPCEQPQPDSPVGSPPASDKPYHSKRPHKKSRSGCRNCKARKVKCDEARPTCRSCTLRKADCVYPNPNPPASSNNSNNNNNNNNTFHASPEPSLTPQNDPSPDSISLSSGDEPVEEICSLTVQPLFRPRQMDATDMKLLWFYTSSTSSSFSVDEGPQNPINDILRNRLVQIAFKTPFLMDSLFGLAIRPEDYPALIANSLLLTALSSQNFRDEDAKKLYIIDWMIVWRGIGLVIDLMGVEKLMDSGLYGLFNRPPINIEQATHHIPSTLLIMFNSIEPGDPDYLDVQTYYETLQFLGSLYQHLQDGFGPIMMLRIITWLTFVPRRFVQLAREHRPRALIVLAYYSAFLKLPQDVWWINGVGQRSLQDLCEYLGLEWQQYLLVPHMARFVGDELEIGRVLFEDPSWSPKAPSRLRLDPNAAVTLVDETGRRVEWIPAEKKLVLVDSRANGSSTATTLEKLKQDLNPNFTFDP
ncbi:hypothetical protein F66182_858 [Fusarium sp. NRRL 66182]|nr:hypothetical protein F66182_858 [Fusarium sp. NRRL 66182]